MRASPRPHQVLEAGAVGLGYPEEFAGAQLIAAPETFATKRDAAAWLARAQTDIGRGRFIDPPAGRVTLAAFSERFLCERVLAERTAETYRGLLVSHTLPALGDIKIGSVAPGTVRAWHARVAEEYPATARRCIDCCEPC